MNASKQSVAVIGAGPGGLAAAVLLAASGAKVTVFESQARIGGRTARISSTAANGDRYHFDTGPTFFMMPYVLEEIFAAAGRRVSDYAQLHRLDPMYRLVMIGRGKDGSEKPLIVDTTQDIAEMSRRLGAINAKDGENFPRFIADNRYKLRHSESILRNPIRSPLDLFGKNTWLDTLKVGPVLRPDLSVHQLLGKYFTDPATKLAVSFQSKYLGMSPYDCPSLFTILPFIEYEYGVWHPIGGCNALMEALATVAGEHGADIRTNAPVEKIEFRGKKATSVVSNGRSEQFDHVVINADASWAIKKLIPENVRASAGRSYSESGLDSRKYSCSTFMLYLGIEGKVNLPHHTICIAEDYQGNLEQITKTGELPKEPSFYVCNPSALDPSLAPAGHSALYVLIPIANLQQAGAAGVNWENDKAAFRELALARMEKILGESALGKDFRSRIRTEVMYTPDTWKGMNINFGATFNLAHNLGQMLHKRPQNKLPFTENVYLVGGGTHPGSGLPTIFLSSQISSRMLCDEAGLEYAGDIATTMKVRTKHAAEEPAMT